MELRQLEYLVALAEEESFTKAANRVYVTQPCVSAQIKRLERELGQPLIDRGSRSVRLTEAGAAALPYARAALAAVRDLRTATADLTGLANGQVTVGAVASSLSPRLPELLASFSEKHPGVGLSLSQGSSDQLAAEVRSGKIDVAIIGVPDELPYGLRTEVITEEALVGAVSHSHPLARHTMIAVRDVERYPLLCLPSGSGLRAVSDAVWEAAGITPKIALEANDPQVLVQLATRGLGMAILPAPFARTCAEFLHPVEISSPRLRGRLALTWKAAQPVSPATRALVGHTRAAFASHFARDAAARSA